MCPACLPVFTTFQTPLSLNHLSLPLCCRTIVVVHVTVTRTQFSYILQPWTLTSVEDTVTVLQLKSLSAVRKPPVKCEIDSCEIGGAHSGVVKIQFSWDVTSCGAISSRRFVISGDNGIFRLVFFFENETLLGHFRLVRGRLMPRTSVGVSAFFKIFSLLEGGTKWLQTHVSHCEYSRSALFSPLFLTNKPLTCTTRHCQYLKHAASTFWL